MPQTYIIKLTKKELQTILKLIELSPCIFEEESRIITEIENVFLNEHEIREED